MCRQAQNMCALHEQGAHILFLTEHKSVIQLFRYSIIIISRVNQYVKERF